MKTITTKNETCSMFGNKITTIFVNGNRVITLTKLENGLKSGYDSRDKYLVFNVQNNDGVAYWKRTARTIKDVINFISK